ncbi:MAG: NlpC/P60 family protein [bacterium]|nr:NlpC/P60 family protein [bacterium]
MHKQTRVLALLLTLAMLLLPTIALADTAGTITGNDVNLRTGPSTATARLTYLYRGDNVRVTGESGNWYAVTYGDLSGYVYKTYVSLQTAPSSGSTTLLRSGSRGSAVKQLQEQLILLGYLNDRADGIFGRLTDAAVRQYQRRNGLTVDGIAGKITLGQVSAEAQRVQTVVNAAKAHLGLPYLYGGTSPSTGFDCSGLTQYAFRQAGITIPRVSYEQAAAGRAVPYSQLRVGDLVAFNSPVSHVGIYVGNGQFIHSPRTGDVVKISKLSAMQLTAIRRFTGVLAK